jgi:hypothetical protein
MSITPSFSVESELAAALALIGCVRVTDLLGRVPSHANADFFFDAANLVAELKCLDEDKIRDDRIIEKASTLYLEELTAGRAPEVVFGEAQMTTSGYSAEFTSKIAGLYRVPIERQIRKADKQIAETKVALDRPDATGLLIIANNNHTALDPWHAWSLIDEILNKPAYPNINSALLFAGNLGAVVPGHSDRIDYWIEFHRKSGPAVDRNTLSAIRNAWFMHLGKLLDRAVGSIRPSNLTTLARLESR